MWVLIITLLEWTVIILAVTQVLVPLIFNYQVFWLFRKRKVDNSSDIEKEIKATEAKIIELKQKVAGVKNKTKEELDAAKQRDEAAGNLL